MLVDIDVYYTSSNVGRHWHGLVFIISRKVKAQKDCMLAGRDVEQEGTRSTTDTEISTSISKHALIWLGTQEDQYAEALSECVPAGLPEQQFKRAHAC